MLAWEDSRPLSSILPARVAKAITSALGISTVGELLLYFPRDWSHHGNATSLGEAMEGDTVTFVGRITQARSGNTRNGKFMHTIAIAVGAHTITATFFQARLPARQLTVGTRAMFSGKIKYFRDSPQLSHPSYVVIPEPDSGRRAIATGGLRTLSAFGSPEELEEILAALEYLAVYPIRKGITSWALLGAMNAVLANTPEIPEPLDEPPADLPSFDSAIRHIHQPDEAGPEPYMERIKYNEALSLALVMAIRRMESTLQQAAPLAPGSSGEILSSHLPFSLTSGQEEVIGEIYADMAKSHPMNRLLQGDVGAGKTVVALMAMLAAVDSGKQCAMLAPTEVLAVQHARSMTQMLMDAGLMTSVVVLTGSMSTAAKREALLHIVSGEANIVVGTHALIQESVEFFDLGLVVVDEQHRFGVEQRDSLRTKAKDGLTPHLLVMTATPIPRTIAMTAFGDLEVSILSSPPKNRQPIATTVVPSALPAWEARAWERIREEVAQGRQAFVVCPKIDGEGGVEETYEFLKDSVYPDLRVAMVHGRMHPDSKDEVMTEFAKGNYDVLVATTVIEVGIDVPNATVMYIRDADAFGVSQLHQLRGRVGRGQYASICLLHTSQPQDSDSYQRLEQVASTTDGFKLAEIDLRTRQEGDVLGTAQSGGKRRVYFLDFIDDAPMIERAAKDASALVARNIDLAHHLVSDVDLSAQEFIEKS
ncbi:MAG: ATP-dependent DNA helicase RecG [Corynebacterium sp.]|nr:ATP-dependent DNA helicase RecG [Corynebacterium sp.]